MAPSLSPRFVPTICARCPVRDGAICAYCDGSELAELDRIKTYRTFQPADTVAWAGERTTSVGSVIDGVAMLSATLADGRRQMVGLLLPSDFLGRPGRATNVHDVVAATEITFCMYPKPEFERLVACTPHLERRLLEMTLDELDRAREWMLLLGRKTAREKIASLLVILARRHAALGRTEPHDGLRFPLHITREAMADYLGLTVETVSRQISALRRDGLIELDGRRLVHAADFMRLIRESGEDAKASAPR